ncbi:trigger factor [Saccharospirillum salsuginis]|uniref:Trigger factor n=1 Tax=Saccharospirillum salsuginis TaxID=418750 RepID=A0A918K6W0_9GAMM|nr:trigger factor [Saccharospirillum salsuginis]GGX51641.1 trigger factor [Saccharospirillum salsuginis]
MQVSVEATQGLERRLKVGVPASEVDNAVNQKLKETARRVRLDGFRPGKVPVSVVKQRFGDGIRAEVLQDVVRENYAKALSEEQLTPAGMPSIEFTQDKAGEDVEFVATFEVFPEVKLAEIEGYEFEKPAAEVTDADIDKMLDNLRQQRAEYKPVEREAKEGDQVKIDFVGKVDGEAFKGGSAEDQTLVLGSGSMIPGFEAGIEGMKAGETKAVEVTFPEDYGNKDLAGKSAVFDITVHEVAEAELPELNEEFFKAFGAEGTDLESFKVEVRKNMEREARNALQGKVKNDVIEKLLEDNPIDVPSALIDEEIGRLQQQAVQQFGGGAQMDPSSLPKELFQDQAERRVKIGLLMNELINSAELKADDEAVRAYIEDQASVYQDPQQVIDYYYSNAELLNQVRAVVVENAAIDYILSKSKVAESTVSYEDAVKSKSGEQG